MYTGPTLPCTHQYTSTVHPKILSLVLPLPCSLESLTEKALFSLLPETEDSLSLGESGQVQPPLPPKGPQASAPTGELILLPVHDVTIGFGTTRSIPIVSV
jgi:hypothetical protein